jgi:hypothetical protein
MWIQSSSTPGDWRKDAGSGAGGAATNQGSYSGYGGTKYYLRNGGPGLDTTILGAKTYGAGGSVSGGHGAGTVLANSGAGGWGAGSSGSAVVGGAGGSGIVIVRFPYTAP